MRYQQGTGIIFRSH